MRKTNSERSGPASLYDLDDDWSRFEIARDEFERACNSNRENQPG
jgi:hypothetical protein